MKGYLAILIDLCFGVGRRYVLSEAQMVAFAGLNYTGSTLMESDAGRCE